MVASDNAQVGSAADTRTERYRRAEQAFWDHYGLAPVERFVEVGSPPGRLRVQELGSGEPVLFVNGTGGPGAYFATGRTPGPAGRRAADPRGRGAAVHPAAALAGGPDHHPRPGEPADAGQAAGLAGTRRRADPGGVHRLAPRHVAETDWSRHERDMVRAVVGPRGYVPGLVLTDDEIAGIEQPTLMAASAVAWRGSSPAEHGSARRPVAWAAGLRVAFGGARSGGRGCWAAPGGSRWCGGSG
jgi:hypothetical protein